MTTVTGTITGPGGSAPAAAADRKVVITLVDLNGRARSGFTDAEEIVTSTEVTAATDGTWSVVLPGNVDITSDWGATLYRVDSGYDPQLRQPYSTYIDVPDSGTHWVGSLRTTPPGGAAEMVQGYLALTGGTLTGPLTVEDALDVDGALTVGGYTVLQGGQTNGDLAVLGALAVTGNVGFYGTSAAAKPTVSGSRGGNAALASLLTALAGLGLITDSTTA